MYERTKIGVSFFRYNIVALIATAVDFLLFILLAQVVSLWYVLATFVSTISGGIVAFVLNRNWAFDKKDKRISIQITKYTLVWVGSILLNTWGLYFLVENSELNKIISKVIVSIAVGIGFNYVLYKYYVFK